MAYLNFIADKVHLFNYLWIDACSRLMIYLLSCFQIYTPHSKIQSPDFSPIKPLGWAGMRYWQHRFVKSRQKQRVIIYKYLCATLSASWQIHTYQNIIQDALEAKYKPGNSYIQTLCYIILCICLYNNIQRSVFIMSNRNY